MEFSNILLNEDLYNEFPTLLLSSLLNNLLPVVLFRSVLISQCITPIHIVSFHESIYSNNLCTQCIELNLNRHNRFLQYDLPTRLIDYSRYFPKARREMFSLFEELDREESQVLYFRLT